MSISIRRRAMLLAGALGISIAVACGPGLLGVRTIPGTIESLTIAARDSIANLATFVGCDTVSRIAVGSGTTPVEICATSDARLYGPGNAPFFGKTVAQMRNLGSATEARFGLKPNKKYKIAANRRYGGSGWSYWQDGGAIEGTGVYHGCPGHGGSPDSSSASFGSCGDNPGSLPSPARIGRDGYSNAASPDAPVDKRRHFLLGPGDGPAWISCTDGCCTTDEAETK